MGDNKGKMTKLKYDPIIRGIYDKTTRFEGLSLEDSLTSIMTTPLGIEEMPGEGIINLAKAYRSAFNCDVSLAVLSPGQSILDAGGWEMEIISGVGKGETITQRDLTSDLGKRSLLSRGSKEHYTVPVSNVDEHDELNAIISTLHRTAIAYTMRDGQMYGVDIHTESKKGKNSVHVKLVPNPRPEDQVGGLEGGDHNFTFYVLPVFTMYNPPKKRVQEQETLETKRRTEIPFESGDSQIIGKVGLEEVIAPHGTITLINVPTNYDVSKISKDLSTHASQIYTSLFSRGGRNPITGLLDKKNIEDSYKAAVKAGENLANRVKRRVEVTEIKKKIEKLDSGRRDEQTRDVALTYTNLEKLIFGSFKEMVAILGILDEEAERYRSLIGDLFQGSRTSGSLMEALGHSVKYAQNQMLTNGGKTKPEIVIGHLDTYKLFGYSTDLSLDEAVQFAELAQKDFKDREFLGEKKRANIPGDFTTSWLISKVGFIGANEVKLDLERQSKKLLKEQKDFRKKQREERTKLDPSAKFNNVWIVSGGRIINAGEYKARSILQ